MIKRFVWMSLGAVVGASGSYWANRRVRRVIDRYAPVEVRERVQHSARRAGGHVRSAIDEGRAAMREREAQLKGRQARRPGHETRR